MSEYHWLPSLVASILIIKSMNGEWHEGCRGGVLFYLFPCNRVVMNKWMYNFPGVICEAPDLVKSFEDPESFPALPVFSTQTGVRLIQRDEYYNLYMK